jgi:hypothetical protein
VIKVIMRSLVFAAAAIAFSPLAQAEDAHPSQAACDAAKIGARELADCLRTGADKADRELAVAVEAAINRSTLARACYPRRRPVGAVRSMTRKLSGSPGAIRSVRTSRHSNRAWTQRPAIRACVASSTTTPSAYRASRRVILELRAELGFCPRQSGSTPLKEISFGES